MSKSPRDEKLSGLKKGTPICRRHCSETRIFLIAVALFDKAEMRTGAQKDSPNKKELSHSDICGSFGAMMSYISSPRLAPDSFAADGDKNE